LCRSCAVISLPRNFANGASQIKIMIGGGISSEKGPLFAPQYTDAEIRAAVEEAATRDTYVAVHVYHADHIRRTLEKGVMSIEHGQFIDEPTARLLKEKGAFISPFTAGLTPEALRHLVYGKPGTPQNIKGLEFQALSKIFVDVITAPLIIGTVKLSFIPTGNNSINGAAIPPEMSIINGKSNVV